MSSSLVRKSLELVESDVGSTASSKNKDEIKKPVRVKKSATKQQRRILGDGLSEAARQVEQARRRVRSDKDHTSENLQKLAILSSVKIVNHKTATKILEHSVRSRRVIDESAPSESTCFTEEDFKKFEEEYFVS